MASALPPVRAIRGPAAARPLLAALLVALGGCASRPPATVPAAAATTAVAPGAAAPATTAPVPAAGSAAGPAAESAAAAAPTAASTARERETADIRRHHLQRLDDKLASTAQALQESCRYESDIATRPPKGRVALTFDDGPEPGQTEHILSVLQKYDIPAVFFMVGAKMQRYPELVAKVRASGRQIIGNHSWDHPNFHDIAPAQQAQEVLREEPLLAGAGGQIGAKVFRYPFGNASCETNALVRARGYKIVGWHIDSCDWAFERTGSVDFKEATSCGVAAQYHGDYVGHVVSAVRARNGGIVLMHEIHPKTVARLEEIVLQIRGEGFAFGTVLDEDFQDSLR
jgi:peptidoglycan/xylan/chitin deacetylase (PgdA/CDA1 family)